MRRTRLLTILVVAILIALAGCSETTGDATPTDTIEATSILTDAPTSTDTSTSPSGTTTSTDTPTATPAETPITTPDGIATTTNGTLSVHFLNVGQGASTLVVGPTGETMLIDSGDWRDDGEIVLEYLRQLEIERLDYLVTSHADADHIGGHAAVIEYLETEGQGVGAVYDPGITSTSNTYERYLDAIETHNVTLYQTRSGDEIPLENVDTQILAPPAEFIANDDRNENSLVMRLGFGNSTLLIPGDGEMAAEEYLRTEYGDALNVTVLSAGHHGSQSSTGDAFLDTTAPKIAVISSAYDSQYGHPDAAVLQRLAERSVQTYWTATHGTIRVTSNGSAITVATQADAPTAPLDIRDSSSIEPGSTDSLRNRTIVPVAGTPMPVATDGGTTPTETVTEPTPTETPTSTETPTETTTETPTEGGTLSITEIHEDAQGTERDNLNDEFIVFANTGDDALDLSGWTVADKADHTYTFPDGFTLDSGAEVTLHTGRGSDAATDLYWGSGSPIWNNAGDTVIVRNDSGDLVLEEGY